MSAWTVFCQQMITGLSNGMIVALIALGYTMVYGIIELINFAHGDLFMLGCFMSLTVVALLTTTGLDAMLGPAGMVGLLLVVTPVFCAGLNWTIDRLAYKPLRHAPRLSPLVSAIGVSFVLMNLGLFWGGVPIAQFNYGRAAASPKDFPNLIVNANLLGSGGLIFSEKDLLVLAVTLPLVALLTIFVKGTRLGTAMRAVAQNPLAAQLMGIDVNLVISVTFALGGALAGFAAVIYSLYNNTIYYQMGYRIGMDAFTAAVLGGIGSMPGALLGGVFIGLIRALSDQYIATRWTNVVVFSILVLVLVYRPSGLLGARLREKV